MRNISSWSILHPVPTAVLFILLTVAGVMGYGEIRINRMPDIDLPGRDGGGQSVRCGPQRT